jgi:DNA repair protein RecO (recombination protein O)
MHLIKLLTAESQKNQNIYKLIEDFYILLKNDNWIIKYIFWELELFKILGFDLDFKSLVDKKDVNNQLIYVSKSSLEKKIIPNFLVEKTQYSEKMATLLDGLKLVGDYLNKTILKPNNLTQPISRKLFIDSLK